MQNKNNNNKKKQKNKHRKLQTAQQSVNFFVASIIEFCSNYLNAMAVL